MQKLEPYTFLYALSGILAIAGIVIIIRAGKSKTPRDMRFSGIFSLVTGIIIFAYQTAVFYTPAVSDVGGPILIAALVIFNILLARRNKKKKDTREEFNAD